MNWTETDVAKLLHKRFPPPAFVLLYGVRNTTGYAKKQIRTADALAISVWPSRGLYFSGIEIKVRFSDWRKELSDPTKAQEIQKYCKYWYVAAPKGVVPPDEIPEMWGLLECTKNSIQATKEAKENQIVAPDVLFVASLLRSFSQNYIVNWQHKEEIEKAKEYAEEAIRTSHKIVPLQYELDKLKETIESFENASGVKIGNSWNVAPIGEAVQDVLRGKSPGKTVKQLKRLAENILNSIDRIEY